MRKKVAVKTSKTTAAWETHSDNDDDFKSPHTDIARQGEDIGGAGGEARHTTIHIDYNREDSI
jgi:hypothetical protein